MSQPTTEQAVPPATNESPAAPAKEPTAKEARKLARAEAERLRMQAQAETAAKNADRYGIRPMPRSTTYNTAALTPISQLRDGEKVVVRARLHAVRRKGKVCFALLRQENRSLQAVASVNSDTPAELIAFMDGVAVESVVDVGGTIHRSTEEVKGATERSIELHVSTFHVVNLAGALPFGVDDSMRPDDVEGVHVAFDTRLNHRCVDLRGRACNAIFRIQSRVGQHFRTFLTNSDFVEIHTPKIIGAASEGGANVFALRYFDRPAFLAQSPQLYKQMCVMGDLPRVFEVGPVFRAENSNTHRHLTEFVGLDVEMAIREHYYEVLDVAEALFGYIFTALQTESELLAAVQSQYPFAPLEWRVSAETIAKYGIGIIEEGVPSTDLYGARIRNLEVGMIRIPYRNCIALLNTVLETPLEPTDDINTSNEKRLGALVRERYGVDWFISDRFPSQCRPFYTMPCPDDPQFTNSYDMFIRGEEISSGAQRIHDADMLLQRGALLKVDMTPLRDYVDSFRYGAWPHGGFGVGLERVAMLYLALPNIRFASLFPRDPHRVTP